MSIPTEDEHLVPVEANGVSISSTGLLSHDESMRRIIANLVRHDDTVVTLIAKTFYCLDEVLSRWGMSPFGHWLVLIILEVFEQLSLSFFKLLEFGFDEDPLHGISILLGRGGLALV